MAKGGLGKGLSALISEQAAVHEELPQDGDIAWLSITQLQAGVYQPRRQFDEDELRSLANSIRNSGVVQPVVVRTIRNEEGRYEIVAGERRWRAASLAGLKKIPAVVRSLSNKQAMEMALIENIQRENLNVIDEAAGYQRLLDEFDYTHETLSSAIGKSRSAITNTTRLLGLPESVQARVSAGEMSGGHARAILMAADPEAIAAQVVKKGLSVRQTEALVKKAAEGEASSKAKAKKAEKVPNTSPELAALEAEVQEILGLELSVQPSVTGGGKIVISYQNDDELAGVFEYLGAQAAAKLQGE